MVHDYEQFISTTLHSASKLANNYFGQVKDISTKSGDNNQVLTEADHAIGDLIVSRIKQQFPTHNIIDEEAGVINNNSEYTWVVDPIDGTSNFANSIPTYGILLGLLKQATPVAGGLACPSFDELYFASQGNGATLNGKAISVSKEENLLDSLISYGIDGHQENPAQTIQESEILSKIILGCRNLRTSNSAYDFGLVASGRYGGYLNQTSKIWDNVAAQIIIQEAGGSYTDFFGQNIDYSDPITKAKENFTYCSASPKLHTQLQSIIRG